MSKIDVIDYVMYWLSSFIITVAIWGCDSVFYKSMATFLVFSLVLILFQAERRVKARDEIIKHYQEDQ